MFRSLITLSLLLLGLVTPARAQDGAPADEASAEARRVEHARQFAIGMSTWPTEWYCSGPMSAAMQQVPPQEVLRRVQLASRCGVRLVLVPPRRMLTVDGQPDGRFSVDEANRVIDHYARELPPDTLTKYRSTLLGFNLADDYGCLKCWGGKAITQGEIADWAGYARQKLPGLPLGVRVVPEWVGRDPKLAPLLDYAWAQYHTRKGDAKSYFDEAAATAEKLGLRLVMGVNVKDCYGVGTTPLLRGRPGTVREDGAGPSGELRLYQLEATTKTPGSAPTSARFGRGWWRWPRSGARRSAGGGPRGTPPSRADQGAPLVVTPSAADQVRPRCPAR